MDLSLVPATGGGRGAGEQKGDPGKVTQKKAIAYLPAVNDLWLKQCIDHCNRHDYEYMGVVVGDEKRVCEALQQGGGEITLVIVARSEHFRPAWWPEIETVGDDTRRITREVVRSITAEREVISRNDGAGRHCKTERRPRLIPRD